MERLLDLSCKVMLALLVPNLIYADLLPYGGKHEILSGDGAISARHFHDWDSPNIRMLFMDFLHHEKFFSSENDFAYVEVSKSGSSLFRTPSPALSYLWVSEESGYVVGLSDIKLWNPYQLVVWRCDGQLVHSEHVSAGVAKLTSEEWMLFGEKFLDAKEFLKDRVFVQASNYFVDFESTGICRGAYLELLPKVVPHPYSADFRESMTNTVYWFKRDDPKPVLGRNGNGALVLSLLSPSGKVFSVLLGEHAGMIRQAREGVKP